MKAIEDWAAQKQTADWLMAAAKQRMRWGIGKQVSEGEFDEAVAGVQGIRLSGYPDQQMLQAQLEAQAKADAEQRDARRREAEGAKTLEQQIAEAPTITKEG